MTKYTPNLGLPYPEAGDKIAKTTSPEDSIREDFQSLAVKADQEISLREASVIARVAKVEPLASVVAQAVQVTTSVDGYETATKQGNIRYPFRVPVNAQAVRVCVANRNDASETNYTGSDIRINQRIYIGEHKLEDGQMTGQFATPPTSANEGGTKVLNGGTPYVGEWTAVDLKPGREYLLSLSFANPPGDQLASGMGTNWIVAATGSVNQMNVEGLSKQLKSVFQVWIEVMVPAKTPTLAWVGDSTLVGRDSRAAVHDSPAWFHGMAHGVIPRLYGIAGSRITDWIGTPNGTKWTRLAHLGRCDAAVIQIGANDVFDFVNRPEDLVAEMKARLAALIPLVRQHVASRIYLATPKGRSTGPYSAEFYQALNEWCDYLRTLPHGAEGCYDLNAAVADPGNPNALNPVYVSDDNVHLLSGGNAALARAVPAIVALPVPPDPQPAGVTGATAWRPVVINPGFASQGSSSVPSVATDPSNPNRRDMRWGFANTGMSPNGEFTVGRVPAEDIPANSYYATLQTNLADVVGRGFIDRSNGDIKIQTGETLASWYMFDQTRWYVK